MLKLYKIKAFALLMQGSMDVANGILNALENHNLCSRSSTSTGMYLFSLHRLVSSAARDMLNEDLTSDGAAIW